MANRIDSVMDRLKKMYPRPSCALRHKNPFELLIATILSAQCTDERVNAVTPALFARYPSAEKMAKAALKDVETLIHSTGFFRQKAKSLVTTSELLVRRHGGEVPSQLDDLVALRGVARKTANVVMGTGFGKSVGVVVDTHVTRLSRRLGLTKHSDPIKIEKDLMAQVPPRRWIWLSHALIEHGRKICRAVNPRCSDCPVRALCPSALVESHFPVRQSIKNG